MLAFTYSRLKALSGLYREAEAQMDTAKRVTREEPLTWEVPDEIAWQRDYRALEARVLGSFIYYELTSLAHMLGTWGPEVAPDPCPSGEKRRAIASTVDKSQGTVIPRSDINCPSA